MTEAEVRAIKALIVAVVDESDRYPRGSTQQEREGKVNHAYDRLLALCVKDEVGSATKKPFALCSTCPWPDNCTKSNGCRPLGSKHQLDYLPAGQSLEDRLREMTSPHPEK